MPLPNEFGVLHDVLFDLARRRPAMIERTLIVALYANIFNEINFILRHIITLDYRRYKPNTKDRQKYAATAEYYLVYLFGP